MFDEKYIQNNVPFFIDELNDISDSFDRLQGFLNEKDRLFAKVKEDTKRHIVAVLNKNGTFYKNDDIRYYKLSCAYDYVISRVGV